MKKIFALSTTICALLFASSVFADITTDFSTGKAKWEFAELGGSPTTAYDAGANGADYLTAGYDTAVNVAPPNGSWYKGFGADADWIGPYAGSGEEPGPNHGYTSYKTSGFQFMSSDKLVIAFSADNAITNLFISNGKDSFDVFDYDDGVIVKTDYSNAGSYGGPDYGTNPYGGSGLFQGYGEVTIDWNAFMEKVGMDANGTFDIYFIAQNTNLSGAPSPSGFIAKLEGNATPEPATLAIMGLGFLGAGIAARRRNKK